jgi:hypothetical protein
VVSERRAKRGIHFEGDRSLFHSGNLADHRAERGHRITLPGPTVELTHIFRRRHLAML